MLTTSGPQVVSHRVRSLLRVPCQAAGPQPRLYLASVSPVSLGLLLVCGLGPGLGVFIVRRIRRDEQREEKGEELEVICKPSHTELSRF